MVGEVEDSRSVALGGEGETELVVLAPFVARHYFQIAGIALLPVFGIIHELDRITDLAGVPNLVLEPFRSSVKMVRTVVYRKGIDLSVDF